MSEICWLDEVAAAGAPFVATRPLAVAIGLDRLGLPVIVDLAGDEPHLLIAGQSGSGKSSLLHAILVSLLERHAPAELSLAILDPMGLSGAHYRDLPHLFAPPALGVDSPAERAAAIALLDSLEAELTRRMALLREHGLSTHRDLAAAHPEAAPPALVAVIDEAADLALSEDPDLRAAYERATDAIARKGRPLGVHLALSLARPTVRSIGPARPQLRQRVTLRLVDRHESAVALDRDGDDAATMLEPRADALLVAALERRRFRVAWLPDEETSLRPGQSVAARLAALSRGG